MDARLTVEVAYKAMYAFFLELHERFGFDQFGGILGGMSLLEDGSTADAAIWNDWLRAVDKAKRGQVDPRLRLQ